MKIPEGFAPKFLGSSTTVKIKARRKRLLKYYFEKMNFKKFNLDSEDINLN